MSDARHRSSGCWICRLRRKGCDSQRPACRDCTALGIECDYGPKPAWMDGGDQKQLRAEQLKKEIKRNAAIRRARGRTRIVRESGLDSDGTKAETAAALGQTTPIATPSSPAQITFTAAEANVQQAQENRGVVSDTEIVSALSAQHDFEPGLLMSYLDYAFPILFPFYKPRILEGGRAWLLTLAMNYPAFYHNIVGLAACFYSAVPVLPGLESDACAVKARDGLRTNIDKAVQGVQDCLRDVTRKGIDHSLADNVRLLGNIVQLVNFEVVFASSESWQMHLTAAADLFSQTIQHHGCGHQVGLSMKVMLEKLRGGVPSNCAVWSSEQAALRFFAALVLYQDIIASTAREQAPTLSCHYDGILSKKCSMHDAGSLNLEDFTGCQNWVLRAIADISALDQWKKEAKQAGTLDIMDLVRRATSIQNGLHAGLSRLEDSASSLQTHAPLSPYQPLEFVLAESNITNGWTAPQRLHQPVVSRIWAHAAQVYLTTVLSGWQPRNAQLRSHIACALDLLCTIDNPSWLRALAWPFCVTGCFATEEQETTFRNVTNSSGGLAMFGTMRDALAIMEKMWGMRDQFDADTWDVASCLRILGHSVLLI